MARVLIVEDSPTQTEQIRFLLEDGGFEVVTAEHGKIAMEVLAKTPVDVVLTDLQMPEMNGLELVEAVRSKYPVIPVILMTAHGSEEIAAEALQKGAASYVPKRVLEWDIIPTLTQVLEVAGANRQQQRLLECLMDAESSFLLDNDTSLIPSLNGHVRDMMVRLRLGDETGLIRIGIALHEALVNAIYHGNLELSSQLRQADDEKAFYELAARRRLQSGYKERRVHVHARVSRGEALFVIRDQGPGFDHTKMPDPNDPANLESVGGRGLLLIKTFMDEVRYNPAGNELTMVKRQDVKKK